MNTEKQHCDLNDFAAYIESRLHYFPHVQCSWEFFDRAVCRVTCTFHPERGYLVAFSEVAKLLDSFGARSVYLDFPERQLCFSVCLRDYTIVENTLIRREV